MTKLEALAKDCIENHTHKLVDKPTKQDIYLREESIFIQGYRQSEKRIAELEAQIEKLIDFVLSKIECCDVCPITDTCIISEGTCPYAGILAKGEEEVTREWIMQFICKGDKRK